MPDVPAAAAAAVNGEPRSLDATPDRSLLEVLREDLGLTGTRDGCGGEGACGSCAVLVDGRRTLSCTTRVADVAGRSVTTIEGLASGDALHPAQRVFLDEGAFQCGFCTSGMILSVVGHLAETPDLDDAALLARMDANLCRCCGYAAIGPAVVRAAAAIRADRANVIAKDGAR